MQVRAKCADGPFHSGPNKCRQAHSKPFKTLVGLNAWSSPTNRRSSVVCRLAQVGGWEQSALQLYEESRVYQKVVKEAKAGGICVTLVKQQHDQQAIDTCLAEALKFFGKEARRYKLSREGVIIETTFSACDPPNRYPNILAAHCGDVGNKLLGVAQTNSGLMVHTRMQTPDSPFYPRVESLETLMAEHEYLSQALKPRGMYFALGSMWSDYQLTRCWAQQVARLPARQPQFSSSAKTDPLEVVTLSVRPDAFTWDASGSGTANKILVVDNKDQWEAVEKIVRIPGMPSFYPPDWRKMVTKYAGIDVRLGRVEDWYVAPRWVGAWDVIGPCIWNLAAVEAELEVRTCSSRGAVRAWIKAQEAKATSVQVLLDMYDDILGCEKEEKDDDIDESFLE